MTRTLVAAAIAVSLPLLTASLGLSKALGAHPFWDVKTIAIGAPLGLAVGLALHRLGAGRKAAVAAGAVTLAACGLAYLGKIRFAASYAEDTFAGLIWYYGWIATGAALATALFLAMMAVRKA